MADSLRRRGGRRRVDGEKVEGKSPVPGFADTIAKVILRSTLKFVKLAMSTVGPS